MLEHIRRLRLKRLARGLPPNPKRRFDPVRALEGDLNDAARAFAREAADHGTDGEYWRVWREIQRELKRPLKDAVAELSVERRKWFGVWSLKYGDPDKGIVAYLAFVSDPRGWSVLPSDNRLLIDTLLAKGWLSEAVRFVDGIAADGGDVPSEQCRLCVALIDAGDVDGALARIAPVRERHHDLGDTWAVAAIAHAAAGRELDARRATVEAAKCDVFDELLAGRLVGAVVPAAEWEELKARHAYQPPTVEEQQRAWGANPGADLVPREDGPHAYGGDAWRMPACRGCGHPIHAWFTLDLEAIPSLQPALPSWRYFPLLSCIDCMVWMGRHDYVIDPVGRTVELLNVGISTKEYGKANVTTPPIATQPAALASREPVIDEALEEDPPDAPQVGGVPSWTQDATRVYCPACRNEMAFVASMASPQGFTPAIPINNESGFQYHFACAGCRRISVLAQWT